MPKITDAFNRANGALGSNWATTVPSNAESGPNTFQGNVLINGNGYGPINAFGGDACSLWAGGGSFVSNQWAQAVINSVAPYEAVLNITAAAFSAGNTTYTYTVTSGNVTAQIGAGKLYVVISGMAHAVNNGVFTASTFGAGTFTVANASGVSATETGTGSCPSDSGAGVMVRGQGTTAATLNGYFFHAGTNSFFGDNRVAYHELWKVVNGVGTILFATGASDTTLPLVGEVIAISVNGSTVTAFKNNVVLAQVTDTSIPSGGTLGVTSWSMNGPNQYIWANWTTSPTATGNNGTTLNNFVAGDTNFTLAQLASDSMTEGVVSTQLLTDSFPYANGNLHTANANWVFQTGVFTVSSNKVFSSTTGFAYRTDTTWQADQYSEVTAVVATSSATQNCGPAVRVSTSADNAYCIQFANNLFQISKCVAGTFTPLATSGSFPVTGDVIRLQVVGNVLTCFKNGTAVTGLTNIVDNTFASGQAGIFGAGNAVQNGYSAWNGGKVQAINSQFTAQTGTFFSDVTAGVYPIGFTGIGNALAYQNGVSWPADQYCQVKMTGASLAGGQQFGAACRVSTSQTTFYSFYPVGGTCAIAKVINGTTGTVLNSKSYTYTQNDVFQLVVVGNMLVGSINGTPVLTAFDNSIVSGNAGFFGQNTVGNPATPTGTFSNWSAGSVTLPTAGGGSSATTGLKGQPVPIVVCDRNGNVLAVSGTSKGTQAASPWPIVFTNTSGNAYVNSGTPTGIKAGQPVPVVLTDSNGNALAISGTLTGVNLGRPVPVVLCDPNGNAFDTSAYTRGAQQGNPFPVVLTDSNGNIQVGSGLLATLIGMI